MDLQNTILGIELGSTRIKGVLIDENHNVIASGSHGNVELYAGYVANPYEIRFHANGGEGEMAPMAMTYDEKQNLTRNGFIRSGYTFEGWARTADGQIAFTDGGEVLNLENKTKIKKSSAGNSLCQDFPV